MDNSPKDDIAAIEEAINATRPVFPQITTDEDTGEGMRFAGLTKRELFAAMAMQGLLASSGAPTTGYWANNLEIAERAIIISDKLLASLAKDATT